MRKYKLAKLTEERKLESMEENNIIIGKPLPNKAKSSHCFMSKFL